MTINSDIARHHKEHRCKDATISRQTRDDILKIVERIKDIDTATKNKVISGLKSI